MTNKVYYTTFWGGREETFQLKSRGVYLQMQTLTQMLVTIICAVIASSGFWAFVQKKMERKDVKTKMLIGLGHDRIMYLAMHYIERGWITQDEYENLVDYLYKPYEEMGGNGAAKRVVDEVKKLPIRSVKFAFKE